MKRILAVVLFALVGCHSDPYSGVSNNRSPNPVQPKPGDPASLLIDAPVVVDFTENIQGTVTFGGHVPLPGTPILDAQNLPDGAQFDVQRTTLTWTPPSGSGEDASKPGSNEKKYLIKVVLKTTADVNKQAEQSVALLVHHPIQPLALAGPYFPGFMNEGSTYQARLQISGGDNPSGPFDVSASDLPAGLTIAATDDPKIYMVTYSPNYSVVTKANATDTCSLHRCRDISLNLKVADGRGGFGTVSVIWKAVDVRVNPIVAIPTDIAGNGTDADLYVHVEDPNGESIPRVKVDAPATGNVEVTTAASSPGTPVSKSFPTGSYRLEWKP